MQEQARLDGRRCVVGALIIQKGRVLVLRRSDDRSLFPGCWDIVGGHVEPGETLAAALEREVREETGWRLRRILDLVAVTDWETVHGDRVDRRREFDFLVAVDGDLSSPHLEAEKFSAARWIGPRDLPELRENRQAGDDLISRVVSQALVLAERAAFPQGDS
ncbi:MAG: NUDIX domain-containing protein [Chloroflexi bacterium]|nr:NUDIX domain-containing protein [Chloroflexota bacterium]